VANQGKRARNGTRAKQTAKFGKPVRKPQAKAATARRGSKTDEVLAMLQRANGTTLYDIMQATGWQAHSVRGFISGTLGKKMRLTVASTKGEDGQRRYAITA
jgi:hypothetical protein